MIELKSKASQQTTIDTGITLCILPANERQCYTDPAWLSLTNERKFVDYYIMAGHAIVVVKDINLLFYHGNAVILTLR